MGSIPVGCSRDELKQHSFTVVTQAVFTGSIAFYSSKCSNCASQERERKRAQELSVRHWVFHDSAEVTFITEEETLLINKKSFHLFTVVQKICQQLEQLIISATIPMRIYGTIFILIRILYHGATLSSWQCPNYRVTFNCFTVVLFCRTEQAPMFIYAVQSGWAI